MSIKIIDFNFDGRVVSNLSFINSIKKENNRTRRVGDFSKHENLLTDEFISSFANSIQKDKDVLDFVVFSAVNGAEPHIDMLPKNIFGEITYIYPIILPMDGAFLTVGEKKVRVGNNTIYEFNHQTVHSLETLSKDGCVLIMCAEKHSKDLIPPIYKRQ